MDDRRSWTGSAATHTAFTIDATRIDVDGDGIASEDEASLSTTFADSHDITFQESGIQTNPVVISTLSGLHAQTAVVLPGTPAYDHVEGTLSQETRTHGYWSDGFHSEATLTITNTLTTTTGWDAETAGTAGSGGGVNSNGGTTPPTGAPPVPVVGTPVVTYQSLDWVGSSSNSWGFYEKSSEVTDTSLTLFGPWASESTFSQSLEIERGGTTRLIKDPLDPLSTDPFGELYDFESSYSSSQILADGTVIAIDQHQVDSRQIGQFIREQESTIEQHAPTPLAPVESGEISNFTGPTILIAVQDLGSIGNGGNPTVSSAVYTTLLTEDSLTEQGTRTHISTDVGSLTTTGTPIEGFVAPPDDATTPDVNESEAPGYTYTTAGGLLATEFHEEFVADGDRVAVHSTSGTFKQWTRPSSTDSREHYFSMTDQYGAKYMDGNSPSGALIPNNTGTTGGGQSDPMQSAMKWFPGMPVGASTTPRLLVSTFAEDTSGTGGSHELFEQTTGSQYAPNGYVHLWTDSSSSTEVHLEATGHGEWNDPLTGGLSQFIEADDASNSLSYYRYERTLTPHVDADGNTTLLQSESAEQGSGTGTKTRRELVADDGRSYSLTWDESARGQSADRTRTENQDGTVTEYDHRTGSAGSMGRVWYSVQMPVDPAPVIDPSGGQTSDGAMYLMRSLGSINLAVNQARETRDMTYELGSQVEFTNGVTVTTSSELRNDSATSVFRGVTSNREQINYDQERSLITSMMWTDDGTTATRETTSDVTATATGRREKFAPDGAVNPDQRVNDAWFTLDAQSSSHVINSGVVATNGSTGWSSPGLGGNGTNWAWTTTGTQSSTLLETVGRTTESVSMTDPALLDTMASLVTFEKSTSATELGSSATVLATTTGSGMGNSWSSTTTDGTYSYTGAGGLYGAAYALVPVGSDGLSFALSGRATNMVGDHLVAFSNDPLGGGYVGASGAENLTRGWGTSLTTQLTEASLPGSATTNSDHAGYGSGEATSSSSGGGGYTAYDTGTGGGGESAAESEARAALGPAGLQFVKTAGQIIATGDAAVMKSVTNQVVSAIAKFIVCDGNSCIGVVDEYGSNKPEGCTDINHCGGDGAGVQVASEGYFSVPYAVEKATEETLDDMTQRIKTLDPTLYAYLQSRGYPVYFTYENGGMFDTTLIRIDMEGDHANVVVNTDVSSFNQFVDVTRQLRNNDTFKEWLQQNTKPVRDSIRPIYNDYGEQKSAEFYHFDKVTKPWMKKAGATESEISRAYWFKISYSIVGPGESGEQFLLAISPLAAKSGAQFNRGAAKAQAESNARIDGAKLTQVCLNRSQTRLHKGQQDKHVPGTRNYIQEEQKSIKDGEGRFKSILTHSDPQKLLDRFTGTGFNPSPQKEVVDIGELMGFWQDTRGDIGPVGHFYPTTMGVIHYNKSGGGHIIPSRPNPFR